MEDESGISAALQHPRRNLGNRYRSQAEKFLKISNDNPRNLSWAEQNARQSVLYDFTNEENWKILIKIKVLLGDSDGARAVLEDLFTVLGRDPSLMDQLIDVELIDSCEKLLIAAIKTDPLDPESWWSKICGRDEELADFAVRLKGLDVSDQRANILFSRRLERIRREGNEDMFLELSRFLLAQRPNNHEAWEELGRMYERREEYDEAWLCYDQSQSVYPESTVRDKFRERMSERFDRKVGSPWKAPPISERTEFLDRLRSISTAESANLATSGIFESATDPLTEVIHLRESGKIAEAFFLARRMATEGEEGAAELVNELIGELDD